MLKKPRNNHEKILNKSFLFRIFYNGFFIGSIVLCTFLFELFQNGWKWGQILQSESTQYIKASSTAFVILVMIQMVHAFNAKSEITSVFKSGILKNTKLILAVFISLLITVAIVEVPFLQKYLHTTGLSIKEWITMGFISLSIILVEETRKWLVRSKNLSTKDKLYQTS